jgi:signal transduction histidine kinase
MVEDDGRGFDVVSVSRGATGYGLTSMRERALALPGSFEIESAPERGTTVGVSW